MKKNSQEWKDWCDVYEYMKKILDYNEDMKLPKYMTLRLKGLSEGKFMANKKQKLQANYEFPVILITMKICRGDIDRYITRNQSAFTDENHKFNGIMVIIEKEINDVVLRMRKAKKSEEKVERVDMSHQQHKGAQYKKEEKRINSKLNDLW